MSFTYDLASSDENLLNISKVRLELGDITQGSGVRPDGTNLSDEELGIWLSAESKHIMHTVIRACDALARAWTNMADITVGPRSETLGRIADDWATRAKDLRSEYGNTSSGTSAFGVASARTDGYSANADNASL